MDSSVPNAFLHTAGAIQHANHSSLPALERALS